jgi:hypothetical protein
MKIQGVYLEIKSSNEVMADKLLRTEATFSVRAVAEASILGDKDPNDPSDKPADTPRVINLVIRKDGGTLSRKTRPSNAAMSWMMPTFAIDPWMMRGIPVQGSEASPTLKAGMPSAFGPVSSGRFYR